MTGTLLRRPPVAALLAFVIVGIACFVIEGETRALTALAAAAGCEAVQMLATTPAQVVEARTTFAAAAGCIAAAVVLGGMLARRSKLGWALASVAAIVGIGFGVWQMLRSLARACAVPPGLEIGTLSLSIGPMTEMLIWAVLPPVFVLVAAATLLLRLGVART